MGEATLTYPQWLAKFIINDFTGLLKKYHLTFKTNPIPVIDLFGLTFAMYTESITRSTGRQIIEDLLRIRVSQSGHELHS